MINNIALISVSELKQEFWDAQEEPIETMPKSAPVSWNILPQECDWDKIRPISGM